MQGLWTKWWIRASIFVGYSCRRLWKDSGIDRIGIGEFGDPFDESKTDGQS